MHIAIKEHIQLKLLSVQFTTNVVILFTKCILAISLEFSQLIIKIIMLDINFFSRRNRSLLMFELH